jgi:Rhs element Vgr protein
MANSPSKYTDRVLAYTVTCNGKPLDDSFELISAHVRLELNRIGKATLRFNAGDMDNQQFDETDSDYFKPGNSIKLDAGELNDLKTLFEGVIIETSIKINKGQRSQMVVECRDNAYQATQGRKNRIFEKKKDSEILKEVLSAYGSVSVDETKYQHPEIVQYYCSDWDFALSRADACGMFIYCEGSKIGIFKPKVSASPVLTVTYGSDMIDFDGGLSSGDLFSGYEAVSWDPATQKQTKVSASAPELNEQGDLTANALAGSNNLLFQTDAPKEPAALQEWVNSMALKAGLARYRGKVSFYGAAEVIPGCLIELKGLGKRFNGNAYIGSVTHIIEKNEWITEAGIGVQSGNITEEPDVVSPPAGGFLPGTEGLHTAIVKKIDSDPAGEYRIQVELPWLEGKEKMLWARFATAYASSGSGYFFLPEPEDEVLVGFINNDPSHPVILGEIYGSKHKAPFEYEAKNNKKAIVTRSKLTIEFDEEKKILTLHTPGKNKIEISDEGKSITLSDQNKNTVVMDGNGISLSSAKDLTLKAQGGITLDATSNVKVSSKSDVSAEGANVNIKAKIGVAVKGNASAEFSAAGKTVLKGGMVLIN